MRECVRDELGEFLPPVHRCQKDYNMKINKSEEIRKAARAICTGNEKVRPRDVITYLKAKGIEVVSPQVSMVLKKMGIPCNPRKPYQNCAKKVHIQNTENTKNKISFCYDTGVDLTFNLNKEIIYVSH